MSNTDRRTPANSVDRDAFRDMARKFAEREIKPRWQQADRDAKFPREFYVAAAQAGGAADDGDRGQHGDAQIEDSHVSSFHHGVEPKALR